MQPKYLLIAILGAASIAHAQEPPPATVEAQAKVGVDIGPIVEQVIQQVTSAEAKTFVRGTVRRARRAFAIGPTAGGWAAYAPSPELGEQAVTFGLGLEVFKIPVVPDVSTIKALIIERLRAKLVAAIADRFKGVAPPQDELERMAIEIFEEVKAEILDQLNARPKMMERPRFSLAIEANRLFESEAWLARMRLGIGIWRFTLAGSAAIGRPADDTVVFLGPELSTHLLLSKGVRTPVVTVFVRGDFEVTNREPNTDLVTVGARFLLDII